ncbi:hydroxylamine reductase [uncultured Megasphaera sp.]|uniref:hydroxylamine reductase n=1 Tax=uncultured Megasphaera sp. TaxID=165188 RepID=UPI0025939EB8|nr:hydroxylamine reductase [uncultured Megasphaera sp.]
MTQQMFCFQCEQTNKGLYCSQAKGNCGKNDAVAHLQDELTGALINLATIYLEKSTFSEVCPLFIDGLFATMTNVNFEAASFHELIQLVHDRIQHEGGSPSHDYDLQLLWADQEDIRSLKSLLLFGLRGMAAYAHHAYALGYKNDDVNTCIIEGLSALKDNHTIDEWLSLIMNVGKANLTCMEMLDTANTSTYGTPSPVSVPLTVDPGPFIVVTGHDLKTLECLLKQTEGTGVSVYTHGEMLPAHAYPQLKKYTHLKGNFGTAWQNQQQEFANLPGAILFTTNCLMPPRPSYADRVFTTAVVGYADITHIDASNDFSPVIKKAITLGGYTESQHFTGINGGTSVQTGFGHQTVLSVADTCIKAIQDDVIRHIFLVGGCDGAKPGRNYYTEFVKKAPSDTLILTLACGKYRFNDLNLGTIGGLPRLMDMGQCNDAYSAIKVALALSDAFHCSVNDLPLTLILSWYEQKAVCILLTLLYLGVKNIYLGPSLPAFISPNILQYLVKHYHISPISTPEKDLATILPQ